MRKCALFLVLKEFQDIYKYGSTRLGDRRSPASSRESSFLKYMYGEKIAGRLRKGSILLRVLVIKLHNMIRDLGFGGDRFMISPDRDR